MFTPNAGADTRVLSLLRRALRVLAQSADQDVPLCTVLFQSACFPVLLAVSAGSGLFPRLRRRFVGPVSSLLFLSVVVHCGLPLRFCRVNDAEQLLSSPPPPQLLW